MFRWCLYAILIYFTVFIFRKPIPIRLNSQVPICRAFVLSEQGTLDESEDAWPSPRLPAGKLLNKPCVLVQGSVSFFCPPY